MRFLHSGLGRWLSPDPFAESQGPNPYTYVENNPTGAVDPSGAYTLTANGPPATPQLCGGVNKNVTWTINGQPAIVGAIIQQITLMADIYSCTGANSPKSCNIIHWQNGDQSPVTFWEVWNVNTPVQNNFNIGFNNDLWRLPSCPCTYGDFWILGTATFYSNLLVTLPPAWPFRPSGSGGSSYSGPGQLSATGAWSKTIQTAITNAIQYAAQQLQGTPGYPQITSSPPLSRSLGGTWYCCPNPSDAENTNIIDDSPS